MTSGNVAERTLPHNLEAERSVLGSILVHSEAFAEAAEIIDAGHFFRDAHRRIFDAMAVLAKRNVEIDFITLREELSRIGVLEDVGGPAYITSLVDGVPRAVNIQHYARIVKEKASLRELIYSANRILASAYDAEDEAEDIVDQAEQAIYAVARDEHVGGLQRLSTFLPEAMDQIEIWGQTPGAITGVPTGFVDLDAMTRGLQPGTLVIVAARPAMGKSSLVLNIGQHVGSTERVVAFFSLEMSHQELTMRSIASEAAVDGHRLQRGQLQQNEYGRLAHAFGVLSELNLYIDASPFVTVLDIKARARRLKAQARLDLLIVDYTQLMVGHERHQNRTLEIAAITRGLKALSKDLHVPVVALSQLNRDLEKRDNKRPMLADLRDSGALEQDADVVMFIYRDEVYYPESQEPGVAEIIIAKHRNGPIGTVRLAWMAEQTRFRNLAQPARYEERRLPMENA